MWIFAVPFYLRRIKIIIGSMFLISLSFTLWIRVSVIAEPTTKFPFHSLCCDSHQLLSEDQKCVGLVLGSANPLEELNTYASELVMDPLFQCTNVDGSKRLYFTTGEISQNGTIVEPFSNRTLLKGDYCVQPSTRMGLTAVLFCRRPVQIRKCCPLGQLINRTSIDQCVVSNKDEPPSQLAVTHFLESTAAANYYGADDIVVQDNASLQCDFDYNVYLPGYFIDHGFKVSQELGLYVKKAAYGPIRHSKNYCVDSTVYANGTEGPIAMICLPKSFYVMRWLLNNVYSIFNLISAVLLLITFLVHLLLASLRENIQTYSMLSFFACLIVMHFQNGIFLLSKYEPHTWCLNKACISGYFRYASSTWITVMGYNIFRQLRTKISRRLNRRELMKAYFCRCLYAWGLPLALILISHYYKEYNGCPTKLKRCWSCDSVSRNLSQAPNIVLLTGNLIFFIPSAAKIYKSLSFLQGSVPKHALSKVESSRARQYFFTWDITLLYYFDSIHTIFRLFVLMQFYTAPRIIQWFVDSDRAHPELLMLCATIFLMIGPSIFYLFVCRRGTLNMIKAHASSLICRHRHKFPWLHSQTYQVNNDGTATSTNNSARSTVSTISSGLAQHSASTYRLYPIDK